MASVAVILRPLGLLALMFALTMLLPILFAAATGDAAMGAFDEGFAITLGIGAMLWLAGGRHARELHNRDAFLLVGVAWTLLPALAALPLLAYFRDLSFTDAYFEAVSGLTTTGATVLNHLDELPPSINLWRGEMVWVGGMGLIVLAVAILPLLGVGGRQIFKAETPGPMKEAALTPRIAETARGLWKIYVGLSVCCIVAYRVAGMNWLDAVVHGFTTLGLGGFSTHDASFGYWDSPRIEFVSIVFMLAAGMNFATHFLAWRGRSLLPYRRDPEAPWYLAVTLSSAAGLAAYLVLQGVYGDAPIALRYAMFNAVSIATTTGYANTDYGQWPVFVPLWMLFLSSFASCSGSTGGGIKMVRALLLYKQVYREFARAVHPQAVLPVKLSREPIPPPILYAVLAFLFLYISSIVGMTVLLASSGMEMVSAFSAVVACINNTGPGLDQVGPATTYESLTDFQTWVCSGAMLLGRLELFTLLILFTPVFWER